MGSEPYIISGVPPEPVGRSDVFYVLDNEGIVHSARTYTRQIYAGHGTSVEEDLDATDCDIECDLIQHTRVAALPVTCVACQGSRV